jgi:hypothetical protein
MTRTVDTILGRAFASLSAEQQAEVINAAGLYAVRTYESEYAIEMQACQMADHLDTHGWKLLRFIAKFDPMAMR